MARADPWSGALDLREALSQERDQYIADPSVLRAKGLDPADLVVPKRVKTVAPVYPDTSIRAGAEGLVRLHCLIDEKGTVGFCKVIASVDGDLDRAAVDAASQWRYEPAKLSGVVRRAVVPLEMTFRLR
jgi:TonB family protein